MPLVSITRARVRRFYFAPGFARYAVAAFRQAQQADGFLGGSVLRDRKLTFWTMTVWDRMESMRAYMLSGSHKAAMPKFVDWCDEASVVHWETTDAALPNWAEAERRMRTQGRASKIRHPSQNHADLTFAPARLTASSPIPVERASGRA
jgi:heme-degrading monooxygenase HmoA